MTKRYERALRLVAAGLFVCSMTAASGCGASAASPVPAPRVERGPRLEDALGEEPPFLFVLRPATLARDPLYGPLLRRVSQLAAARAALADAVGSTMLAILERTDEVAVAVYDRRAADALVLLRGVPADADATRIVDTAGKPLWVHRAGIPGRVEELAPADAAADAELFVLPRRAWAIAVGAAVPRARVSYARDTARSGAAVSLDIDDGVLASARVRGDVLARGRADGPLAPVFQALDVATVSLEPGPQGAVGEVVLRLVYGAPAFATRAEPSVADVVAAYTRELGARAPWLHAVKVSREERAVVVKGRIPRAWADGLLHVELGDLAN